MDRTEQLMKIICEHIQTGECLARCDDNKCLQVKDFIKEIQTEAIIEFAERLRKALVEDGIYPAFAKNIINNLVKEMTEKEGGKG